MTQKSITFDGFAIVAIVKNVSEINFWFMTKSEAVNRMKSADLIEQSGQL